MIVLRLDGGESIGALTAIKLLAHRHPGDEELEIRVGERSLLLGPAWRYADTPECRDALSAFGTVEEPNPNQTDADRRPESTIQEEGR